MAWKKVETASSVPDSLGRPNTVETWMLPDRDDVAVATITKDADDAVAMTVGGETVQTGASALTRTTTTIDATVGQKQFLLPAVGAGVRQIVSDVIVRNASQSLAAITGGNGFNVGFNLPSANVCSLQVIAGLVNADLVYRCSFGTYGAVGVEGDRLGCAVSPPLYPPMIVTGAGTEAANGTYAYADDVTYRPKYVQGVNAIYWTGTEWVIYDDNMGLNWYTSEDDVATPDLVTTWVNTEPSTGDLPVPTVTVGANPTFDVDVFYYEVAV